MDEFRISDVARYTGNYTPPGSPFTPDASTEVLYHFDDGSGQTVTDASGNGVTGVLGATNAVESSDPTWQDCTTLAIFLTQFTGILQNNTVILDWTAFKDDISPGSFDIGRSADGTNFSNIGSLTANESAGTFHYTFTDPKPNKGNNFYRLLMIEYGSANNYSNIIYIANSIVTRFSVFPTITHASLNIQLAAPATIAIIDAAGATLKRYHLIQSQSIDVSVFAKGFYFIVNQESGQALRFIKN
jgi:hypothetical protein